jgi:hypothetical protein
MAEQRGSGMTKPIPGAKTDPGNVPKPSQGGSNARDTGKRTGSGEGNGAQKRKATKQKK